MAKPKAPRRKSTKKIAVDSKTVKYWTDYFGPFGVQWTGEIPRRVAAGLITAMNRRAAANSAVPDIKLVKAELAPKGKACKRDSKGRIAEIRAEGVFRGVVEDSQGKQKTIRRFFHAVFDGKGQMTSLESVAA